MTLLYKEFADRLARQIDQGAYLPGDRLPGVRVASQDEQVSPSTIVAAYEQLERDGYIESRPRSGFYVRPRLVSSQDEPGLSKPAARPKAVTGQHLVAQMLVQVGVTGTVQLGANLPGGQYIPTAMISREIRKVTRQYADRLATYEMPLGLPRLRGLITQYMARIGRATHPEEILITNGCQEAIYLALQSLTKPGDVVAVESPTYYGLLQVLDTLGLKAIEIPTHSRTGISTEALQLALEQWPVKACVLVPNFSNPLGALMPQANKKALLRLLRQYPHVSVIEDDIYGDLYFGARRPAPLKALDSHGQVLYCNSFSKSVSAGLRVGWMIGAKHLEQIKLAKFAVNCATPVMNQMVLAGILESSGYERHLRGMRLALAQNVSRLSEKVLQHFPQNVRISRPDGGLSIWVELPRSVDTTELFHQASSFGVSIAPGQIFSTDPKKYRHCLRLDAGVQWSSALEDGVARLGQAVRTRAGLATR